MFFDKGTIKSRRIVGELYRRVWPLSRHAVSTGQSLLTRSLTTPVH